MLSVNWSNEHITYIVKVTNHSSNKFSVIVCSVDSKAARKFSRTVFIPIRKLTIFKSLVRCIFLLLKITETDRQKNRMTDKKKLQNKQKKTGKFISTEKSRHSKWMHEIPISINKPIT